MSLSSTQLNGYILRYLHESGLEHTAYVFSSETSTCISDTKTEEPGRLVRLVQRGLQYCELEEELKNLSAKELAALADGSGLRVASARKKSSKTTKDTSTAAGKSVTGKRSRETANKTQERAKKGVGAKNSRKPKVEDDTVGKKAKQSRKTQEDESPVTDMEVSSIKKEKLETQTTTNTPKRGQTVEKKVQGKSDPSEHALQPKDASNPTPKSRESTSTPTTAGKKSEDLEASSHVSVSTSNANVLPVKQEVASAAAVPSMPKLDMDMDVGQSQSRPSSHSTTARLAKGTGPADHSASPCPAVKSKEVSSYEVRKLLGHEGEVFGCAWNPKIQDLLVSCSGDSTARLWRVPNSASQTAAGQVSATVLKHFSRKPDSSRDVTTVCWNESGNRLATGSYDGLARIWDERGSLIHTLQRHEGPIFALKWNKSGSRLLSGGMDKSVVAWDGTAGKVVQRFSLHDKPVFDLDWCDDKTFASCSTDKRIYVCTVGQDDPVACCRGHEKDVIAVRWSPAGDVLASCSDDHTARLWKVNAGALATTASPEAFHVLKGHTQQVHALAWSPGGAGSKNPSRSLRLATASFDADIRIWDPETGSSLFTLQSHGKPVYAVSFSPDGKYIASGAFDHRVLVWSVDTGELIRKYEGNGGVYDVCWNTSGTQLAACHTSKEVAIIDLRM